MLKAVVVLFLVACGAFAVATEQSAVADVDSENMDNDEMDNAPFVPQNSEHDEVDADDADEEVEVSDEETDAEDELEGNTEFETDAEFSLVEADSDASKPRKSKGKGKRRAKIVAPKPIRNKPFKFHSERITAQTGKYEDPEMGKLNLALAAVKEDILSTNKQITDERKWVIAVAKIIASYNSKMKRVEAHIIALRKEMKSLYRKKKQIENLKLQHALEAKLKEARDEFATLSSSLKHVHVKQSELNKSGSDLRQTIAGIQSQLSKLRGQQVPKAAPRKCGKGKRYSKHAKKCVARKGKGKNHKRAKKAKKF